ncbi:MAG: enoyl-CoA hydratase/isomerase family protein [Acetobacteraceae bacterium]
MADPVLAARDQRIGRIRLNRPAALNALDLGMIRAIRAALEDWRHQPAVQAVVIESSDARAFSAGGDIQAIRSAVLTGDDNAIFSFFSEEYALNLAIAEYPKPYIAIIDGIAMGGGIGVSVHGSARIATERAVFAMPETAIGLFPDIGASYFLPRLPGALGTWLGITGARLTGADGVHAGLATHFVPQARLPALSRALAYDGAGVLAAFAEPLPPFTFASLRSAIDRCFSAPSVTGLLERLATEPGKFGRDTAAMLRTFSPSSIAWTFEVLRRGAESTLKDAQATEFRVVCRVVRHPDFAEGVRAMVIDKDRQPHWMPASIEDIDPVRIAAMFEE